MPQKLAINQSFLILTLILYSILGLIPFSSSGSSHSQHRLNKIQGYSQNYTSVRIGNICRYDAQCVNNSVCKEKIYDDELVLRVCQCDHLTMNRVKNACFVKPGHQCYFPPGQRPRSRSTRGHETLLDCMPETECRSSVNSSNPHAGFCMCKDQSENEPHRVLNVRAEIARCSASAPIQAINVLIIASILIFWN